MKENVLNVLKTASLVMLLISALNVKMASGTRTVSVLHAETNALPARMVTPAKPAVTPTVSLVNQTNVLVAKTLGS